SRQPRRLHIDADLHDRVDADRPGQRQLTSHRSAHDVEMAVAVRDSDGQRLGRGRRLPDLACATRFAHVGTVAAPQPGSVARWRMIKSTAVLAVLLLATACGTEHTPA